MIHKILLPTDGSPYSEHTIRYGVELAHDLHAEVVVLYAFDPVKPLRTKSTRLAADFRDSLEQEAREIALETAERLREHGLTVNALAVEGAPAEAILQAIGTEQPDLVVMGIRGDMGLTGMFVPSVAEQVVRHSPVPVLVVK